MKKSNEIWLVGTGPMALEYAKVLKKLNYKFKTIGRGKKSALIFQKSIKGELKLGGIEINLLNNFAPKSAIVAVGVEDLFNVTSKLIYSGTKRILIEKPGALNLEQIKKLNLIAKKRKSKIYIAYNRRFYQSVLKIQELIKKHGKILSVNFEFTEWSNLIKNLKIKKSIKNRWLIANSSHVIDLAFYLCGKPRNWKYYSTGILNWHNSSSRFCGSGITNKGIIFSYFADWQSPGSWGLELKSKKFRYILKPMEELKVMNFKNEIKNVKLNYNYDKIFKPGIFLQTKNFLSGKVSAFCSLKQQIENMIIYSKIADYPIRKFKKRF